MGRSRMRVFSTTRRVSSASKTEHLRRSTARGGVRRGAAAARHGRASSRLAADDEPTEHAPLPRLPHRRCSLPPLRPPTIPRMVGMQSQSSRSRASWRQSGEAPDGRHSCRRPGRRPSRSGAVPAAVAPAAAATESRTRRIPRPQLHLAVWWPASVGRTGRLRRRHPALLLAHPARPGKRRASKATRGRAPHPPPRRRHPRRRTRLPKSRQCSLQRRLHWPPELRWGPRPPWRPSRGGAPWRSSSLPARPPLGRRAPPLPCPAGYHSSAERLALEQPRRAATGRRAWPRRRRWHQGRSSQTGRAEARVRAPLAR